MWHTNKNCGGIVLCGGQSRRMGRPKALLPFGPELMLQRVVRLLSEVVHPIVVVGAPGQELPVLLNDVLVAHDERQGLGPLEGLRIGLKALSGLAQAAYTTSCDAPLLQGAFVQRMIDLCGDYEIAVPMAEGFHPLSAVYRTSVLPKIESLLAENRLRTSLLFEKARTRLVSADELRDIDPKLATLQNLNNPEDYLAALAEAGY
jgi:molybdenum cofactor guanylyltransferase